MSTYYVSKLGLDTNNGSQASPFLTIGKGITTAVNGDTVIVGDGTYIENLVVDKGITLLSVNGAASIII